MALTLQLEGIVSTAKQTDRLAIQTWIKASATNKSEGLTYLATAAAFQVFVFSKVVVVVAGVCFLSSSLALCFGINNLNSNDVVAL